MTRILFLHARLLHGGEDRLVQTLCNGMDRTRFEPTIACLYAPGPVGEELREAGHTVVSHLSAGRLDLRTLSRLRRLLRERQIDVVYTTGSPLPLFWAGMMRRLGGLRRLVVGFHSMGWDEKQGQQFLSKRIALPVADLYIALSETHKRFIMEHDRVADRFAVIPVGIDAERFHPAGPDASAGPPVEASVQSPNGAKVGIVGALRPEKNHEFFIELAALLKGRYPTARFVIVGDGERRAQLEALAREKGVGETGVFLGSQADVAPIVRGLSVLVLTSHPVVETFPQVLLEGMASAVPVVTTDVGSVRDIVLPGECGYITAPGDPAAMAERVAELLSDGALRERMGAAGRRRVEELFTRDKMIQRYEEAFESAVWG